MRISNYKQILKIFGPRNYSILLTFLVINLLAVDSILSPLKSQPLNLKNENVLIINQFAPKWRVGGDNNGQFIVSLIKHFTPNVEIVDTQNYIVGTLNNFTRIIFIGNNATKSLPRTVLSDLIKTRKPILWIGFNLQYLLNENKSKFSITHSYWRDAKEPVSIYYRGKKHSTNIRGYNGIYRKNKSVKVWSYLKIGAQHTNIPFVISDTNLWFVNGLPFYSSYPDNNADAPALILADILHEFFETKIMRNNKALIRLEDISSHIDLKNLKKYINYFVDERVPFAIGTIPNQKYKDGTIRPLNQYPQLIKMLHFAQKNKGSIILHGFFHTFGTGEDYEFWDEIRDKPLKGETDQLYACKVERGISILRDVGLRPQFWETPHYKASDLAYSVFGKYFSHAIENRSTFAPPYPFGPDRFGQIIIPENLGYISPDYGLTVEHMLARAKLLTIVRDVWAVGFIHPAVVPVEELKKLVMGLKHLNYSFVDLARIKKQISFDYEPSQSQKFTSWLSINFSLNIAGWMESFKNLFVSIDQSSKPKNSVPNKLARKQKNIETAVCDQLMAIERK